MQSKIEYVHPFIISGSSAGQAFQLEVSGQRQYPEIDENGNAYRVQSAEQDSLDRPHAAVSMVYPILGIYPDPGKCWKFGQNTATDLLQRKRVFLKNQWPQIIIYPEDEDQDIHKPFWTHFFDKDTYGTAETGLNLLDKQMGFGKDFQTVKPIPLVKKLIFHSTASNDYVLDFFAGSATTAHAVIEQNRDDGGLRRYCLSEMGGYFSELTKPRVLKAIYSRDWKDGKPVMRDGVSHCFKYLRLESYEDALNNLIVTDDAARDRALDASPELRSAYMLNYWLDVETQGSSSLLRVQSFADPTNYVMKIKKPGSDALVLQRIDLIETFNWLIGLWVEHLAAPKTFSAEFEREVDKDLPKDQNTRLVCKRLKQDDRGPYWFRLVEGYTLKVPGDDNSRQKTLVVWRKLTDNPEQDNAALQKFLMEKLQISPRENTYHVIYVNGSHTLPNPLVEAEQTKVRLIEEAFHAAMWSQEAN